MGYGGTHGEYGLSCGLGGYSQRAWTVLWARGVLTESMDCPVGLSTLADWWSLRTPSGDTALINTTSGRN